MYETFFMLEWKKEKIMPLGSMLNSLRLLMQNLNSQSTTKIPVEKGKPDKPLIFPNGEKIHFLERKSPTEFGYSEEYIQSFINELNCDHSIKPNRLLIIKGNAVIGEQYLYPYVKDAWDAIFSASKTVTALALGVLYDQGKVDLDCPVCKILGIENKIKVTGNKKITLRHLLTMSTGIRFNEVESVSSLKWTKSFFDSNAKFKLGSKFEYNSLNSYIVAMVVQKLSGQRFEEFVREHIFDKLDIGSAHFDTSDEDCFKGGWGLYMLPEDMAKLGILVRDYGLYKGKRIISKKWIKLMSTRQFPASIYGREYDYGFQMWVDEIDDFCCFNGMYDQNILIYRRSGVVVVTCFADNESFQGSNLFKIAAKYFSNANMGDFDLFSYRGERNLKNENELLYYFDQLVNKEYKVQNKIANSCGILPLLIQNEVSTYVKGIRSLSFKKENDRLFFVVNEGGKKYEAEFSFEHGIRQTFNFYKNEYDCVVDARFILSGKSEPYLLVRFFFLEFSSSRYFTIKLGKDMDTISVECSENPGIDFVNSIVQVQDETTKQLINRMIKNMNPDLLTGKIRNIFSPIFIASVQTKPVKKQ